MSRTYTNQQSKATENSARNNGRTDTPSVRRKVEAPRNASAPPLIQKLSIGAVDDPMEREADAVAEHVMNMPDPAGRTPVSGDQGQAAVQAKPLVQREDMDKEELMKKPLAQGQSQVQRECATCQQEDDSIRKAPIIQRDANPGAAATATTATPEVTSQVHGLRGRGQPMSSADQSFFAPRMPDVDVSQVRVHTDDSAQELARSVDARAFTFENNIVMGQGEYSPGTDSGRRLMAHELTHVAQQGAAPGVARKEVVQRAPANGMIQMVPACDVRDRSVRPRRLGIASVRLNPGPAFNVEVPVRVRTVEDWRTFLKSAGDTNPFIELMAFMALSINAQNARKPGGEQVSVGRFERLPAAVPNQKESEALLSAMLSTPGIDLVDVPFGDLRFEAVKELFSQSDHIMSNFVGIYSSGVMRDMAECVREQGSPARGLNEDAIKEFVGEQRVATDARVAAAVIQGGFELAVEGMLNMLGSPEGTKPHAQGINQVVTGGRIASRAFQQISAMQRTMGNIFGVAAAVGIVGGFAALGASAGASALFGAVAWKVIIDMAKELSKTHFKKVLENMFKQSSVEELDTQFRDIMLGLRNFGEGKSSTLNGEKLSDADGRRLKNRLSERGVAGDIGNWWETGLVR